MNAFDLSYDLDFFACVLYMGHMLNSTPIKDA